MPDSRWAIQALHRFTLIQLWKREFSGYSWGTFRQDLLAGLTVAAVALPLALAFGVASGATAAAGLVTAILGGVVIGALSGAPYQISGPTGAMSAILILVARDGGLPTLWATGLLAGIMILAIGAFRLGRFIAFVPAPVITGFTAGIAVIIIVGQIDNFLGVTTPAADSAGLKLLEYVRAPIHPNPWTVLVGVIVASSMLFWPARLQRFLPGSLGGIVLATVIASAAGLAVARIGEIPRKILLDERFTPAMIPWSRLRELAPTALSIAALGAVESLLCGAVASKMTGVRLQANQELIAQGVGNIVIPFFGGVPATAAIARTSVGVKSGGRTRLTGIIHALAILVSALLFAPWIGRVPLAALAAVLIVTAWRMNEWHAIRFLFGKRFKGAILTFLATLLATVLLDLTQAILIGAAISAAMFINTVANLRVAIEDVDVAKMRKRGIEVSGTCPHVRVAYLTGPLFFAATSNFNEAFAHVERVHVLVLSMRAVPTIDISGLEALLALHDRIRAERGILMIAGAPEHVREEMDRGGIVAAVGADNFFWSSDEAIVAAERRHTCPHCAP